MLGNLLALVIVLAAVGMVAWGVRKLMKEKAPKLEKKIGDALEKARDKAVDEIKKKLDK